MFPVPCPTLCCRDLQCPHTVSPQVWSHYEETPVEEVVPVLEEKERTANYKPVFVTEITDDLHFYVQDVETGTGHTWAPPAPRGAPQSGRGEGEVDGTRICGFGGEHGVTPPPSRAISGTREGSMVGTQV